MLLEYCTNVLNVKAWIGRRSQNIFWHAKDRTLMDVTCQNQQDRNDFLGVMPWEAFFLYRFLMNKQLQIKTAPALKLGLNNISRKIIVYIEVIK